MGAEKVDSKDLLLKLSHQLYCISREEISELPKLLENTNNLQMMTIVNHQMVLAKNKMHHLEQVFGKSKLSAKSKSPIAERIERHINRCELLEFHDSAVLACIKQLIDDKMACLRLLIPYVENADETALLAFLKEGLKLEQGTAEIVDQLAEKFKDQEKSKLKT